MDTEKKKVWPKVVGGVLILLVAIGVYQSFSGGEEKLTYESNELARKTVKAYVAATGKIESTTTVTVGSQVSGPVSEVLVDFNSPVSKGQTLAKIDPSEFIAIQQTRLANLQSAQAGLAAAQATLNGQEASVRQAEVDIDAARLRLMQTQTEIDSAVAGVDNSKATLHSREAERANALLAYQRAEDLVKRELVALSERDQARTNYLVASAGVETAQATIAQSNSLLAQRKSLLLSAHNDIKAAQSRLAVVRAQRDAASSQVSSAAATVAQAQAAVAESSVDLERTTITSPIDGVVINRKVDEGQTVAAQFTAPELFTIARDLGKMQVKAEVSEADIGRVTEGAPVKFSVDAYPGREFAGSVIQVRSAPDQEETGSASTVVVYGVLVTADNPELLLKPGMTATVEILAEKIEDALVIPGQALRYVPSVEDEKEEKKGKKGSPSPSPTPEQDKDKEKMKPGTRKGTVWLLENDEPVRRDIITGISVDDDVVVVSGDLKEGDKVIVSESGGKKKRSRFRLSF